MNDKIRDRDILKYLFMSSLFVLTIVYFGNIIGVLVRLVTIIKPFILGFAIAYVLNIPMTRINQKYLENSTNKFICKSRGVISLVLSILIILVILITVVNIVVPQVFNTFNVVESEFPRFLDEMKASIAENKEKFPIIAKQIQDFNVNWDDVSSTISSYLTKGISEIVTSSYNLVSSVASKIFTLFISIAFAIYLLMGKEKLQNQLRHVQEAFIKKEHIQVMKTFFHAAHESFTSFIVGQVTEAFVLGTLCMLGMWVFRFPYALTVGVFIGATALIPIVGAYLVAGVGAFLIFMVSPTQAAWFLLYILILQQLENNFIYPRIVGKSIGLPGIFVFIAVIVGGKLGGVIGMLLGVPMMATMFKLLQKETRNRINHTN